MVVPNYTNRLGLLSLLEHSDSVCKIRGHVWKDVTKEHPDYFKNEKFPIQRVTYIRDDKDTSFRVTELVWNYSCERCKKDSISYKKEIVWTKP